MSTQNSSKWKVIQKIKNLISKFKKNIKNLQKSKEIDELELQLQQISETENSQKNQTDTISTNIIRKFWFIWLVVFIIWFLWFKVIDSILLISTAFILSIAVESTIMFFSKFFKRWFAIVITYILLLIFVLFIIIFATIFIINQWDFLIPLFINIFKNLKDFVLSTSPEQIIYSANRLPLQVKEILLNFLYKTNLLWQLWNILTENIDTLLSLTKTSFSNIWTIASSIIWWFAKTLMNFWMAFVLSILFSIEKPKIVNYFAKIWWNKLKYKLNLLYKKMWNRLQWQITLMVLVWILSFIVFSIISIFFFKIQWVWNLSIIMWSLDFIPYLWPIIGAIPAILIWIKSAGAIGAFTMLIWVIIIQEIEGNILVPLVMEKSVWVSSSLVFICLLVLGSLLWVLGIFLSIPVALILKIFLK